MQLRGSEQGIERRAASQSSSEHCAEHRTGKCTGTSIFWDLAELSTAEVFLQTSCFKKKK